MSNFECGYQGECAYCKTYCAEDCYIKELLDDYYNLEKRYFEEHKKCNELQEKLEKYEEYGGIIDEGRAWADEAISSRKKFEKIKPILELYANSKMGELQPDGTYKYFISERQQPTFYATGATYPREILTYDPKPAKEALQIISEVEE